MEIRFEQAGVTLEGKVILHPLDLVLRERRIAVIGLNGSGKTTFTRLINGLIKPSTGKISVDGFDTVQDSRKVLSKVGLIFQNPQNQIILPVVGEDIGFGLKQKGLSKAVIDAEVDAILARFGQAQLKSRRAHELSGGELQLAALCSVLVTKPDVLILDEPTNQLDLRNRLHVEKVVRALPEDVIVITHDLALIEDFDRALLFHEGRILFDGRPGEAIAAYREVAAA